MNDGGDEFDVLGELFDGLMELMGEFAGGREDEGAGTEFARALPVGDELVEKGKCEGDGFTGSGGGGGDEVVSGENGL